MELTLIETNAYLELKRKLSTLSVQMADFQKKIAPSSPEKVTCRTGGMPGPRHLQKKPAEPSGQGTGPLFEHRRKMLLQGSGYPANIGRRPH